MLCLMSLQLQAFPVPPQGVLAADAASSPPDSPLLPLEDSLGLGDSQSQSLDTDSQGSQLLQLAPVAPQAQDALAVAQQAAALAFSLAPLLSLITPAQTRHCYMALLQDRHLVTLNIFAFG